MHPGCESATLSMSTTSSGEYGFESRRYYPRYFMANIFIISDTHFGHANILKFIVHRPECTVPDTVKVHDAESAPDVSVCGCPHMRPFANVEEMDDTLVDNWNKVVQPQDKVYHLGNVAMKREHIAVVGRCNGHKRLVRGNHDTYPDEYLLAIL